jgi:hypothetical protein
VTDARLPWHDAPFHACRDGTPGPIAPVHDGPRPLDVVCGDELRHLRCCACGSDWYEDSLVVVVQAWWSLGAYRGQRAALDDPRRDPHESY